MKILVMNAGSSGQKSCLYEVEEPLRLDAPEALWEARVEIRKGGKSGELFAKNLGGGNLQEALEGVPRPAQTERLLHTLWDGPARAVSGPGEIQMAGHRIVHGGDRYRQATLIDSGVKDAIRRYAEYAPLHNLVGLEEIEVVEKVLGPVPQAAVFDTAFHATLQPAAFVYPGPYQWLERGIRRYGFHGINHSYCAQRAPEILGRSAQGLRLVTCHLGNGCSLAAIRDGQCVDTTMGFTPLEGLMMGTRSGSVDPGILTHLARKDGLSADSLDRLLNQESGLKGLSGLSGDMRKILAAMGEGHSGARLAFDVYVHRLGSGIGAMIASLGGADALVFTAGVGENSPEVRAAACEPFAFMGLRLDERKNQQSPMDRVISAPDSQVQVLVIRAQEDWAIARECWKLAGEGAACRGST